MRAFIIRPFGTKQGIKGEDIDFDKVAKELIDPALTRLGVTGRDTIEIVKPGNIHHDMFQRLLTADLVVADVSIHNANVFYELGIRHALRKRRTLLLRTQQDAYPFDLQTYRYLTYDKDDPAAALDDLIEALRQAIASEDADSPVFQWLPELKEPSPGSFLAVPRGFHEAVDRAKAAGEAGDLGMLAAEAEGFGWESEGLRLVGRAQLGLKDYEGARATWEAIRKSDESDLEANTWLGTIYHRLKQLEESNFALRRVLECQGVNERARSEAYALIARNVKTRWREEWSDESELEARREKALRSALLEESYDTYHHGFSTDLNHPYPGLNAVAMLSILIELARSLPEVWSERFDDDAAATGSLEERQREREKLAYAVEVSIVAARARLEHEGKTDRWIEISAADLLCLTSKRPGRVADTYRKALSGVSAFEASSVRDQLDLYRDLGFFTENVVATRAVPALAGDGKPPEPKEHPRVLLFTGHMIDTPEREKPRFPPGKEEVARKAMLEAIETERDRPGGVAFGIAGGASGGDILFHEICAELGIPTRLLLALPRNRYIQESVAPAGGDWTERFDQLADRLQVRVLASSQELPSWLAEKKDYNIWQRNNLWMLHDALAAGGENVTLIALWNGQEGDGPGGTGDLVERARHRQARVVILDTRELFGVE